MFASSSMCKMLVMINGELRWWFPGSTMMVVFGGKKLLACEVYRERIMHGSSGHGVLGVGTA